MPRSPQALETKPAKLFGIALPVLGDLDPQVEIDLGAQQLLDLAPRGGAHFPQPGAALSDHDPLLAVALDVKDRVYIDQVVTALPRVDLVDHHRQRMRQLIADTLQGGTPNE